MQKKIWNFRFMNFIFFCKIISYSVGIINEYILIKIHPKTCLKNNRIHFNKQTTFKTKFYSIPISHHNFFAIFIRARQKLYFINVFIFNFILG